MSPRLASKTAACARLQIIVDVDAIGDDLDAILDPAPRDALAELIEQQPAPQQDEVERLVLRRDVEQNVDAFQVELIGDPGRRRHQQRHPIGHRQGARR